MGPPPLAVMARTRQMPVRSYRRRCLRLLLLCPLPIGQPVLADPAVTERFNYYDVSGSTVHEVRADLNRNRPSDKNGARYDAITRWHIRWNYRYEPMEKRCAIVKASTTVEVIIIFPRLKNTGSIPAQVVQAFAHYTEKLLLHEKGHAQNAIDTAGKIEREIRTLPSGPSCHELQEQANSLARSIVKEANRWDLDYDLRTRHGATQGARFP
jgi:predicted secreted Zn-dependent protease